VTERVAVRLAWVLAGMTLVLEVVDTVVTAAYRPLFSEDTIAVHGWPFNAVAVVGSAAMGALIVSRFPRNPVGWLLSAVGAGASISLTSEAYSIWVIDHDGPGSQSLGHLTGWLSLLLGGPYALTLLTIMFLIAPDGALLSARWRVVAVVALSGFGSFVAGLVLLRGLSAGDMVLDEGETGGATVTFLFTIGLWVISAALTASLVSAVIRMRRAGGVLHRQLEWITASGIFLPVGVIWRQVAQGVNGGEQTWAATLPLLIAYMFIPICTAVAILRHRLYDITMIVNRAAVLAIGTAFIACTYVVLVVALGGQIAARTGGFWPSLLATVTVALAFQPLRTWVTRLADRATYGPSAAPYEALSEFSQRLGQAPSAEALLPDVAEAAGQLVSADHATATLEVLGVNRHTVTWPAGRNDGNASMRIAVTDGGEILGSIAVSMPVGRQLRAHDTGLLRDLADHASVAFRNAALDAESRADIAALDDRAAELVASRRRILEARDAECRHLEGEISRDILPRLDNLASSTRRLTSQAQAERPLHDVEAVLVDITTALESLRTLSHGVFPTQLGRGGLVPTLTSYVGTAGAHVTLHIHPTVRDRRFGSRVEAAAYFCCIQSVPHRRTRARIDLLVEGDALVVRVDGLEGQVDNVRLQDRVEALAGTLLVEPGDTGHVLTARLPIGA
jgi:hypothetical protein